MREGGVPMTVDGRAVSEEPAALRERRVVWPVRSGAVPPLADGFLSRLETAADLAAALVPGATVVLTPGRTPAGGSGEWLASSGKTQVAVGLAESLWLRDTAARCERVLPRGDRLTRSVQESLTNIAGG